MGRGAHDATRAALPGLDVLGVPTPRDARVDSGGGALKPLDPRLLRTASAARVLLAAGGAVAIAHTASIIAFCWFASQSIAGVIAGENVESLAAPILATAVSILARAVTQAILDGLSVRGAARVKSQLRAAALAALDRGGSEVLARHPSARLAVLLGQGLDAMDGYVGRYLPQLILTAIATPLIVAALLLADLATGITVIVTLPLIPLFMVLIGMATQAMQRQQWDALGTLAQGFLEVVQGLSTLMIFGRQHRQVDRIRHVTEQYRVRTMRVLRVSFLSGFALELAASLSVAVVAVSVGVRLIDGDIAFALGLFVLILVPEAYLPLRQVGAQYHAAAEGLEAANDVLAVLDTPSSSASASVGEDSSTGHPDALLSCRGVRIDRGGSVVIDGLDLHVAAGEMVALSGPSGVGKSSLIAGILELAPLAAGSVSIAGGAQARRTRLAWAGQNPDLTGGTLVHVVSLGDETPDRVLVRSSLDLAAAPELDLDLVVGPAGEGLSGGQAQRVALARAIYRLRRRNLPLLVLDEPTSALDETTEAAVLEGLGVLTAEGRGVLVVSHRPAVLARADREYALSPSGVVA